jgi:hypothetical protein
MDSPADRRSEKHLRMVFMAIYRGARLNRISFLYKEFRSKVFEIGRFQFIEGRRHRGSGHHDGFTLQGYVQSFTQLVRGAHIHILANAKIKFSSAFSLYLST